MNYTKWLNRLNDSKWTRFFMIIAVLQTILVIGLEAVILTENVEQTIPLTEAQQSSTAITDATYRANVSEANDRFYRIKWENISFIAFQIWVLWLSFDGIINQNTVEIIALAVINGLCALVGVVQTADSAKWISVISQYNVPITDIATAQKYGIALTVTVAMFAGLMGYFSWKLWQDFGWNIYKKIGADLEIQSMYKTFQYFVLILKIDVFFQFLSSIFFLIQLAQKRPLNGGGYSWEIFYFGIVTVLILPSLAFARASVSNESRATMGIFIAFQVILLTHFALILSQILLPKNNWYFWIFVVWCGIILTVATGVLAYFCLRKFGKGLKPYVQRGARKSITPDVETALTATLNPKAWEIDDAQSNEEMAQFDVSVSAHDLLQTVDLGGGVPEKVEIE